MQEIREISKKGEYCILNPEWEEITKNLNNRTPSVLKLRLARLVLGFIFR